MSTIRVDSLARSAGGAAFLTFGVAKVAYDYIQTIPAIRRSMNISSITDNAVGTHTANYTNLFAVDENPLASSTNVLGSTSNYGTNTSSSHMASTTDHGATVTDMFCGFLGVGDLA